MKRKSVKDQVIVITGGGSGIGQRVAEILALEHGAVVVILDLNEESGTSTTINISSKGGRCEYYKCNVADAKNVEEIAQQILHKHEKVDIVVCNAAIARFGHFLNITDDDMHQVYDVNVFGTMNVLRAFLPEFEKRNSGHIVAMSSIAGHFGETFGSAYCPTKFATRGLMESLQMEYRDRGLNGIRTTTLFPYFTNTPMVQSLAFAPTSEFYSCMSVDRCAQVTVDSILKERVISYIPRHLCILGFFKGMAAYYCQKSGRRLVGFQLSPTRTNNNQDERQEKSDKYSFEAWSPHKMAAFFRSPDLFWFFLIPGALAFTFLVYYDVDLIPHTYLGPVGTFISSMGKENRSITGLINILAWIAHVAEGLFALYTADKRKYGFGCAFKWFAQTTIVGFPSLLLLLNRRDPRPRKKRN
ncbi:unnamed protein product [Bursaphelenchus okinawaensis]|uniref:Ketoreductase domain-containing protein n=1 Tax=Bursaphelenchus okinawaensis TaxID=465554 RepID=A0A811LQA7_9BILA|nr:unnamed protein product [Bursaphelenchus okinawaensis]CAG9127789.1 unnamed protein product [Bursaphelenchus okinawaensis]